MKKLILLTLFFFALHLCYAQLPKLDSSFGNNGIASTTIGSNGRQVLMQSNGNMYFLFNPGDRTQITHVLANGSIDASYGNNGYSQTVPFYGTGALQSGGKIVVGGALNIFRFNTDGNLDTSFSAQTVDAGIRSVAIQQDGKIVVAGSKGNDFAVARYNTDGTPDLTFSGDGQQTTDFGNSDMAQSVTIQNDGKIVAAGHTRSSGSFADFALARYNIDGTPDITFSEDGMQTAHFASGEAFAKSVALQSDGKILVAGIIYADLFGNYHLHFGLARYHTDGSPDTTFSEDGKQATEFEVSPDDSFVHMDVIIQSDAKILVTGYYALARYNLDGSTDTTFSTDGKQIIDLEISSAAIQSDGKLVVAGSNGSGVGVLARYLLYEVGETSPTIVITTPTNNATYLAHGNVYLTASAADADGTISKVEFYYNSTLLFTTTDTPYTFKWQHVTLGNYILTAKATDNDGLVTTSAPVNISVVPNKPPTASIIKPANNTTFVGPATVHLEADAGDADGRVSKVEFYNGTKLLATELKPPYTYDWAKVPVSNYAITAKAYDNWGAVTLSAPVNISVVPNQPPGISIINPFNGESFTAPATINLEAAAQDSDGRITKVEFYTGTTLLTTERISPYTYQWTNVPAGTYSITALATDNWGAKTGSVSVTVTVISPTAPIAGKLLAAAASKTRVEDMISFKVAPNPANNILNIYTRGVARGKRTTMSLISSSGIIIKQCKQVVYPKPYT